MTSFNLNGQLVTVADNHPHLLSALRDELNVLSPKDGCAPSGQCGCCTVLIDGKARVACQMSMERIESTSIITLEGIDEKEREQYSSAFAAHGALQCGFCIPGIVVRAKALVDKKGGEVSRNDLERHLGAHLCRCTGYTKILEAIESVAAKETPKEVPVGGIGSCNRKYEAEELALGDRPYIDDLRPEGLLHGAVHLASYARADVLKIDTTKAEAIKGVHQVFTAADVPGALRVGIIHTDWPIFIPEGGRTF